MEINSFISRDNALALQEKVVTMLEGVEELFMFSVLTHEEKSMMEGFLESAERDLAEAIVKFEKSKL